MRLLCCLLALLPAFCVCANADTGTAPEHRFSGFASLGIVSSSNEELAFRRDVTLSEGSHGGDMEWNNDSLVGAQWNAKWSHQWDTTVQVVAKDRFVNNLENSVEWAFVRYRPMDGLDLRLGRVGTDIFMISEYRQVGYALPWVRPPHDTYALLSLYHFDGADITKRFDFDESTFSVKLFYGNSDEKYPTNYSTSDEIRLDFDLGGITFNYDFGNWKWRASYIDVTIKNDVVPVLGDALAQAAPLWSEAGELAHHFNTDGEHFTYGELGVNYDNNDWWAQAEVVRLASDTGLIPSGDFGYLSIGKRYGSVSLYALGGYASPEDNPVAFQPPPGPTPELTERLQALALGVQTAFNSARIDQTSVGLGARWDFTAKMALKFQVEEFTVKPNGTNLWFIVDNQETIDQNQSSTVISLAWDMLF
jgi:hypothetical protein